MKKAFLIFSLFASSFTYGQIKKGSWMLGLGLSYSQSKNDQQNFVIPASEHTSINRNFSPALQIGYFVTDKIVVGLTGAYSLTKYSYDEVNTNTEFISKQTSNIASIGLFARGYKFIGESKFGFFGQLAGLYNIGKTEETTKGLGGTSNTTVINGDVTGLQVNLFPGFVYFLTNKIGFEASFGNLSYVMQNEQDYSGGQKTGANKTNNLNFVFNSFRLGMSFYFGGK